MENRGKPLQALENSTFQDYGSLETRQKLNEMDISMKMEEGNEENTFADIGQNHVNDGRSIVPNQRGRISVSKDLDVLAEGVQELKLGSPSPIQHGTKFHISKWTTPMKGNTSFHSALSEIEITQNEFFSCKSLKSERGVQNDSVQRDRVIEELPKSHEFLQADSSLCDSSRLDASPEMENTFSFDQTSNATFGEYGDSSKLSVVPFESSVLSKSTINITSDLFYERSTVIGADLSGVGIENEFRNICDRTVYHKTNNSVDEVSTPGTDDTKKSADVSGKEVLSPEARDFSTVTGGSTLLDHVSKCYNAQIQMRDHMGGEFSVCEQREDNDSGGSAVLEVEKSVEIESTNVSVLQNTSVRSPEHRGEIETPACQHGPENEGNICEKGDTMYINKDQNSSAEKIVTCEECPENIANLSVTVNSSERSAEFDSPVFADSIAYHQKDSESILETVYIEDQNLSAEKIVTREECPANVGNLSITVKSSERSSEFDSPVFADDASQHKSSEDTEEIVYMSGNYLNTLSVRAEVPHEQSAPTGELSPEVLIKEPLIQVNVSEVSNPGTEAELQESRDANSMWDSKVELVDVSQSSNSGTASVPIVTVELMIEEDAEKSLIIHSSVADNSGSPISKGKVENAASFVMSTKTVETSAEEIEPNSEESIDSNHTYLMLQSPNIHRKCLSPIVEEELSSPESSPNMSLVRLSPLFPKTDPDQVAEMCHLEAPTIEVTPKMKSSTLLESVNKSASELQNLEQVTGRFTGSLTRQIQIAEPSILDMSPASFENRIQPSATPSRKLSLLDVSISELENISPPCLAQQTPKGLTTTVAKLIDLSTVKKIRREEFNAEVNLVTLMEKNSDLSPVNDALKSKANRSDLAINNTVITTQSLINLGDIGNIASVEMYSELEKEVTFLRDKNAKLKSNIEEMRVRLRKLEEEKEMSDRNAQSTYKDLLLINKELTSSLEKHEKEKGELETKYAALQKDLEQKIKQNVEIKAICEHCFK